MFIYIIRNKINRKRYIGKTNRSVDRRCQHHVHMVKKGSMFAFHCAIRKYGIDNFELEKVFDYSTQIESEQELYNIEQQLIKEYHTYVDFENSCGYNMTFGGEGVSGANSKAVKQYDLKTLQIIAEYNSILDAEEATGIGNAEISQCVLKRKKHQSAGGFGWCNIDEEPTPYKNNQHSPVRQYNKKTNQTIRIYPTLTAAADKRKLSKASIYRFCKGVRQDKLGFGWEYV